MLTRRVLKAGLIAMGAVGLASAIWPAVATAVTAAFVTVLGLALLAPALLGARWLRGHITARAEARLFTAGEGRPLSVELEVPAARLRETA